MKKCTSWLLAAVCLFVMSNSSTAGPIPWKFFGGASLSSVLAPWDDPDAIAGLFFTANETGEFPCPDVMFGSADVKLVQMEAFIGDNPQELNTFDFHSAPLTVSIGIIDEASQLYDFESLTFTGHIDGYLTLDETVIAYNLSGPTSRSVVLGGNRYTITLTDFFPPGVPNSGEMGGIWAHVDVTAETPEPSTLLLLGLGVSVAGGFLYRRRLKLQLA